MRVDQRRGDGTLSTTPAASRLERASVRRRAAADGNGDDAAPVTAVPASRLRRTQAERRERAERRLLDAALAIVARRGSVRMTLTEVGQAAGYSRGLPAAHFGSKAGLLRALATHIGERFRAQREAAPERAPGLDSIRGSIDVYFSRTDQSWTSTRALLVMMTEGFMEGSELRENVMAYNRSALSYFEHHIRIGMASGEIPADTDSRTISLILLGAMRGVMLQWLIDGGIDLMNVRDRLLAIVDKILSGQ